MRYCTDYLYDLSPLDDLDLPGRPARFLICIVQLIFSGWKPYNLRALAHVAWGGYVLQQNRPPRRTTGFVPPRQRLGLDTIKFFFIVCAHVFTRKITACSDIRGSLTRLSKESRINL